MRVISPYAERHLHPPRRGQRHPRRRGWAIVGLSILILLFALHHFMTKRDWYLLQKIRIVGTQRLTPQEVSQALDLRVGTDDLQKITEEQIRRALRDKLVYVLDVEVQKDLLQGLLTIRIVERTPSAVLIYPLPSGMKRMFLVDLEGAVLEEVNAAEELRESYPTIELTSENAPRPGTRLTSKAALHGLEVLRIVRERVPQLEARLVAIQPENEAKIKLQLKDAAEAWLTSSRIEEGLLNLATLLEKANLDWSSFAYIDARFHGLIYCGS